MSTPDKPNHVELNPNDRLGVKVVLVKMGCDRSELVIDPKSPDLASTLRDLGNRLSLELEKRNGIRELKFVLTSPDDSNSLPTLHLGEGEKQVVTHAEIAKYYEVNPKPVLDAGFMFLIKEAGVLTIMVSGESAGITDITGDREQSRVLVGDQMALLLRHAGFNEEIKVEHRLHSSRRTASMAGRPTSN